MLDINKQNNIKNIINGPITANSVIIGSDLTDVEYSFIPLSNIYTKYQDTGSWYIDSLVVPDDFVISGREEEAKSLKNYFMDTKNKKTNGVFFEDIIEAKHFLSVAINQASIAINDNLLEKVLWFDSYRQNSSFETDDNLIINNCKKKFENVLFIIIPSPHKKLARSFCKSESVNFNILYVVLNNNIYDPEPIFPKSLSCVWGETKNGQKQLKPINTEIAVNILLKKNVINQSYLSEDILKLSSYSELYKRTIGAK